MHPITAVLGSYEFGPRTGLAAQGCRQMNTGRDDVAGGSSVLPTLSESLDIGLSDVDAETATLKGDYMW